MVRYGYRAVSRRTLYLSTFDFAEIFTYLLWARGGGGVNKSRKVKGSRVASLRDRIMSESGEVLASEYSESNRTSIVEK